MDKTIIGIGIGFYFCLFLLYTRKERWQNPKIIWLICLGLFVFGVIGLLSFQSEDKRDQAMYFGFCVPLVYWIFDRTFKRISENIHKRDFILFLRFSGEINSGINADNSHVKFSDKLFSIGLLIIIIGTLTIGIISI